MCLWSPAPRTGSSECLIDLVHDLHTYPSSTWSLTEHAPQAKLYNRLAKKAWEASRQKKHW